MHEQERQRAIRHESKDNILRTVVTIQKPLHGFDELTRDSLQCMAERLAQHAWKCAYLYMLPDTFHIVTTRRMRKVHLGDRGELCQRLGNACPVCLELARSDSSRQTPPNELKLSDKNNWLTCCIRSAMMLSTNGAYYNNRRRLRHLAYRPKGSGKTGDATNS